MSPEQLKYRPSGATMNATYDILRGLTVEQLRDAWNRAESVFGFGTPAALFFRWQVDVTIERKLAGRW